MHRYKITHERFKAVHADISDGSEPARRFNFLVATSTHASGQTINATT